MKEADFEWVLGLLGRGRRNGGGAAEVRIPAHAWQGLSRARCPGFKVPLFSRGALQGLLLQTALCSYGTAHRLPSSPPARSTPIAGCPLVIRGPRLQGLPSNFFGSGLVFM